MNYIITFNIPASWSHTKLVALWKGASKGPASDPEAYRGLQVGSAFCKILVTLILKRLKPWYDETLLDQQQGFPSGRGTADGIYVTKRVQQISDSMQKPVFVLFVDLTAAFDHVIRDWLFKSIYQRLSSDEPTTMFRILESLYRHTTTALAETPDDQFVLTTGVRQGGPESLLLYNLYMDYVMRIYIDLCKAMGIGFLTFKYHIRSTACTREQKMHPCNGAHSIDWSGYADDLELFFETADDLQNALNLLHSVFCKFGLTINVKKTKSMIFNFKHCHQPEISSYPESIAHLCNKPIENVKTFRYLGDDIKYDEPTTGDADYECYCTQ